MVMFLNISIMVFLIKCEVFSDGIIHLKIIKWNQPMRINRKSESKAYY
jgi:hypothetical protein